MTNLDYTLCGIDCVLGPYYSIQNKTSKYIWINWLYKKLYGYTTVYLLEDDFVYLPWNNKFMFKNQEAFDRVKNILMSEVKYNG